MRVVIADDHRLMLDGIRKALEADDGFEIVGETLDGTQVLPIVSRTLPDLVLLDVRMPRMDGLQCLDEIVKSYPGMKVVMLSASTSPELIAAALRRGASAYLAKSVDPTDLPSTLRQVLDGNVWSTAETGPEHDDAGAKALGLTEREGAILQAVARGLSNEEIAKELWVTQQTVKFHLTNIYRKLGAKNRTQASRIAQQHGLIDTPLFGDDE
jgi:DNA-binding NarL/FixJ family response regulator